MPKKVASKRSKKYPNTVQRGGSFVVSYPYGITGSPKIPKKATSAEYDKMFDNFIARAAKHF